MEKATALERYQFKRSLDEVLAYKGRATELISLYIPPTKQVSDVTSYLRNEYSQSSNIKSKSTRKNVMAAIESISSRLKVYKKVPDNGMVFFTGHVAKAADQTEMKNFIIEPPLPVPTFIYRCDSQFYLDPLMGMLEDEETYGLIVIDRSEATVGLLMGKAIKSLKHFDSMVPSKHGRGGQSQRRFERLIEEAAHEFYKKVGDFITDALLEKKDMKNILIGGPGPTKDYFLDHGYLHHELKKKVLDTFDVGYTNESGLKELVENAKTAIADLGITKEKALMQRFYKEVRKDDGLFSYGKKEVLNALNKGAVDILIVSEDLKEFTFNLKCQQCENEFKHESEDRKADEVNCPKCQGSTDVLDTKDFVEELSEICSEYGTHLELVSSDSEEGDMLVRAFGGIAAILRYKM
jgi:peptide chain release factor subunit 1